MSGHRPMYNSDTSEWDSHRPGFFFFYASNTTGAYFQSIIEPLFVEYGVDLYLCGHMHMFDLESIFLTTF